MGSFGSTDVSIGARWGTGDTPSVAPLASDPETWGIGAQVSFGNFTVGGSYAENDNDETLGATGTIGDSEGWSFGVTYDTAGPWSFEALAYISETDHAAGGAPLLGIKTDREAYRIGASRTLGPGVDWDIYVVHETRDVQGPAAVFAPTEVEGTLLGTAINLSF